MIEPSHQNGACAIRKICYNTDITTGFKPPIVISITLTAVGGLFRFCRKE